MILAAGFVEVVKLDRQISCKEGIFISVHLVGGIICQPLSPIGQIIGGSRFNSNIKVHYRQIIPLSYIQVCRISGG